MAPWKEFITTVSWSPTALVLSTPNNKFTTIKIFKCLSTYSLNSWGVCIYFGKQLYITYSVFFNSPLRSIRQKKLEPKELTWQPREDGSQINATMTWKSGLLTQLMLFPLLPRSLFLHARLAIQKCQYALEACKRNAEAQDPLQAYSLRICILMRSQLIQAHATVTWEVLV